MRSDYALYVVAIILFVITGIAFAIELEMTARSVWVVTTAILGFLFIGIGYMQKPKATVTPRMAPPPPAPSTPATVTEVIVEEVKKPVMETAPPSPPKLELTSVKGIKEKRAAQLKTLGINSVEDLAKASAEDLAAKLKISPKFTGQWIENAKGLVEKT